ncbi:GDSL-type esterase/lipase family protein [Aestuariivivens sediminis]|uniref:GDSL-type esterase/lipase family protein n=1 Tax=Aestuariivivens sediminis TaxID=2913557 RepID=UPI001F5AFC31|nr:GDSL-type esterase/lipase family protein [Aestuariivivens sediminis]
MPYIYIKFVTTVMCIFLGCSSSNDAAHKDQQDLKGLYPSETLIIDTHTEWTRGHYPIRIKEFMAHPLEHGDIVFLGNSITEQGGDWGARFHNPKVKNRGIAGDTTDGVLARLNELIYYTPSKVFMLIGINDAFRDDMTAQAIYDNIIKIVHRIHNESPDTQIFLQTVLPTTTEHLKMKIQKINALLMGTELTEPYNLIGLHDYFATENDLMDMAFSTDGVHLNENGYRNWVNVITNLVDKE